MPCEIQNSTQKASNSNEQTKFNSIDQLNYQVSTKTLVLITV